MAEYRGQTTFHICSTLQGHSTEQVNTSSTGNAAAFLLLTFSSTVSQTIPFDSMYVIFKERTVERRK